MAGLAGRQQQIATRTTGMTGLPRLRTADFPMRLKEAHTIERQKPGGSEMGNGQKGLCCSGKALIGQVSSYCAQVRERKENVRHLSGLRSHVYWHLTLTMSPAHGQRGSPRLWEAKPASYSPFNSDSINPLTQSTPTPTSSPKKVK